MIASVLILAFAGPGLCQNLPVSQKNALITIFETFGYIAQRNPDNVKCWSLWSDELDCTQAVRADVISLRVRPQTQQRVRVIPTEIGLLTALTELVVEEVERATIPTEIASLTRLHKLRLTNVVLYRRIPDEVTSMPGLDCLVVTPGFETTRNCAACGPTNNCVVHPGNDCDELCYLVRDNKTVQDEAAERPQFDPRRTELSAADRRTLDEAIARAHGRTLPPLTSPTQETFPADASDAGAVTPSMALMAATSAIAVAASVASSEQDVAVAAASSIEDPPADFTLVYIVTAAAGAIILIMIAAAVMFYFAGRAIESEPQPLAQMHRSDTNYTNVSSLPGPTAYGQTSFSNML